MRFAHECRSVFLALLLTAAGTAGAASLPAAGPVNACEGQALIDALGDRLLILDVRTREEYAQGHLPGALPIPVQELEKRLGEIPSGRPVLVLCRTGRRAEIAWQMLRKARPEMTATGLWYLRAMPEYKPDGTFIFRDE